MVAKPQKYIFRAYRPEYPRLFREERDRLRRVLGDGVAIEHIGSTAVEGLGGKGIIDVMVGVKGDIKRLRPVLPGLQEAGYDFREHASSEHRLFLQKDYGEGEGARRVHLHVVGGHGKEWEKLLKFRDRLRQEPELRERYGAMKRRAAEECKGDKQHYRRMKAEFFRSLS